MTVRDIHNAIESLNYQLRKCPAAHDPDSLLLPRSSVLSALVPDHGVEVIVRVRQRAGGGPGDVALSSAVRSSTRVSRSSGAVNQVVAGDVGPVRAHC